MQNQAKLSDEIDHTLHHCANLLIVNYSGLLYRAYPEPYQNVINTGNNKVKVCSLEIDRQIWLFAKLSLTLLWFLG